MLIKLLQFIYFDFSSINFLIMALYSLAVFLGCIFIRKRSRVFTQFALVSFFLMCYYTSEFCSSALVHPVAVYCRWFSLFSQLSACSHMVLFFLAYSDSDEIHASIFSGAALYAGACTAVGMFVYYTQSAPVLQDLSSQKWVFNRQFALYQPAVTILIYASIAFFSGCMRAVFNREKRQGVIFAISFIFALGIIAPGIYTSLNLNYLFNSYEYSVFRTALALISLFMLSALCIRHKNGGPGFAVKTLWACYGMVLLVMLFISLVVLRGGESAYDDMRKKEMEVAVGAEYYPADCEYFIEFSFDEMKMTLAHGDPVVLDILPIDEVENEMLNAFVFAKLSMLDREDFLENAMDLLMHSHPYFKGYASAVTQYMGLLSRDDIHGRDKVIDYLLQLESAVHSMYKRASDLREQFNSRNARDLFDRDDPRLEPFRQAIAEHYAKKSEDGNIGPESILFILPIPENGERLYRLAPHGSYFLSYITAHPEDGKAYECGFSYRSYRENIGKLASFIAYAIILATVVLNIGISIFFHFFWKKPIREIVGALNDIQNGRRRLEIPDQPIEELALILDGFNSIIKSSNDSVLLSEEKASNLHKKNRQLLVDLEKTYNDYTGISESYEHLSRHIGVTDVIMQKAQSDKGANIKMTGLIQSGFIPKSAPELNDWEIRFFFKQVGAVSGDMFDFFHADDLFGMFLIDISGSDICTGLMTIIAKKIVRRSFMGMRDKKLNVVIDSVNAEFQKQFQLCERLIKGVFLRFNDGKIEYVNAAHSDVMCYTSRSATVIPVKPRDYVIKGSVLGFEEIKSPYEVINFTMNKGDCLFFYSDCLLFSKNKDREEYGTDRVLASITAAARADDSRAVETVAENFFHFIGSEELNDDLTIISIKRVK